MDTIHILFMFSFSQFFNMLISSLLFLTCIFRCYFLFYFYFLILILLVYLFLFFIQVIVKDIVSKAVVAQFRAHKSSISALSFDPSGTLLVTASVQGHNINVFKIMPGFAGSSSASDTGSSCIHLYRLQRGFTNAVIEESCVFLS